MRIPHRILILILFCLWMVSVYAQQEKIGDVADGSRAVPVHLIKLIDEDSSVIRPDEQPLLPFSIKYTCGNCHDYGKIRDGWHFSAGDSLTDDGRAGHPWILADPQSGVQIPLSYRKWPGTFTPEQVGLSGMEFLQIFGRQMTGGSVGDNEKLRSLENLFRWRVSGELEINCLSCHDAEFSHDQAEFAASVSRQNFRWAAAASSGFAHVYGSANQMPDNYDIYLGTAPDLPKITPPQVVYDVTRFNDRSEVFFDIVQDVPNRNCYYCHSGKVVEHTNSAKWTSDQDVHISRGLKCVDCHRNNLDHKMIRGYEDKFNDEADVRSEFTCSGCHLESGRLGAPKPDHNGIPPVHFEVMECTVCHSGIRPGENVAQIKTSMGHALGVHGANKSDSALPHIMTNVFIRQENGKIAPHNLIWPTYWALRDSAGISPLDFKTVRSYTEIIVINDDSLNTGNWLAMSDSQMIRMLDTLSLAAGENKQPVYVSGGKIYFLNEDSLLVSESHPVTQPYIWPIAHDVRPAAQSLGANECQDCHSISSGFYYSTIDVTAPIYPEENKPRQNIDFMDINRAGAWVFSMSFLFRPWLKILIIICLFLQLMILFIYITKAVRALIETMGH